MDIAALSMAMSLSNLQQAASISVLKKAMDSREAEAANITQAIEAALPASEHIIDIKV